MTTSLASAVVISVFQRKNIEAEKIEGQTSEQRN